MEVYFLKIASLLVNDRMHLQIWFQWIVDTDPLHPGLFMSLSLYINFESGHVILSLECLEIYY